MRHGHGAGPKRPRKMLTKTLVTAPTVEPVTLAEAKAHVNAEEHHDDDDYIQTLITVAREWCENFTRRAFNTQTWDVFLDRFPSAGDVIELPLGKLQSVTDTGFTYVDTDGNTTQVSTAVYTVDTDSEPGRVYLAYNQSWPSIRDSRVRR